MCAEQDTTADIATEPTNERCPNCNYCPHCGRSEQTYAPYYAPRTYPLGHAWWQSPWTITCGTDSSTGYTVVRGSATS